MTKGDGKRALAIVNLKPEPKEFTSLVASATLPIQEDYAIVSLLPGLSPGRWIMLLAGTTTLGTQAAVEFACRPDTARQLIQRAGGVRLDRPMEAVIRTEVRGGVPVQNHLVAVHLH
ncbi:MAG: hypothetical protein HZB13_12380 [Acidobacteria bacterium]|nr:hypothetical protein [Acidobacteriota bacterium]